LASCFYSKVAVDYSDGDNATGTRPGYLVEVVENDGGVGVSMSLIEGDARFMKGSSDGYRGVFLHVEDARELISCLQQAVERAALKKANHGWRTREP
jgi:hypothetical protein